MSKHVRMAGLTLGIVTLGAMAGVANATADLSISPDTQTVAPGKDFSVDVNISNVNDLYGYQFDLTFNPHVISEVSSSEGSFLSKGGSTFFIPGTADNTHGIVIATADTLISATPGVSGSGNLVVFTFGAIKAGISSVAISGVDLINSALGSISSTTTGGSVTVSGGVMAPEIDPASGISALTLLIGGLAVLRGRRTGAETPGDS